MKKTFWLTILLLCIFPLDLFAPMAVSISPPKMEFTLEGGKTAKEVIEIKNQDVVPVNLKLYVSGFSIKDDGSLEYESKRSFSAENWIKLVPETMTIRTEDYDVARYEVQVPEGTPKGSYTASVLVEEVKDEAVGIQRAQMQLKGRLAYIVYVNVGKPVHQGAIESISASSDESNVKFKVRVRNDGSYYIRPQGKIVIERGGAKVKEVPYPNLPLLSRQTRTTEVTVPKDFGFGAFRAVVSLDIGSSKTLEAVTNFSL